MITSVRERAPALLALALPTLVGVAWMAASGVPSHYLPVNCAALLLALVWVAFGRAPSGERKHWWLAGVLLLALLAAPVFGPSLNSITGDRVARWLPVGPIDIHSGMFAIPALCVIAGRSGGKAFLFLLLPLIAVLFQPDAASGFALTFAAMGLHHVTQNWRVGLVAIAGFFASIAMALAGELPPQLFVERVLVDAFTQTPPFGLLMALALLAAFLTMLFATRLSRAERFALAGSFFGFVVMSVMSNYPTPLIGFGASPVLGYGLALGLVRKTAP